MGSGIISWPIMSRTTLWLSGVHQHAVNTASAIYGISLASKIVGNYFQPVLHRPPRTQLGELRPLVRWDGDTLVHPRRFGVSILVSPLTQILTTALHFTVIVSLALVFRLVKYHCSG